MENAHCVDVNSHLNCFDLLTKEERSILDNNKNEIDYRKGEIITKQGAFATHIIFLKEGLLKVYMEGEQKDLIVKILPSQRFLGLSSMYEGNNLFKYSSSAFIESKVTLYNRQAFEEVLKSNSNFAFKIISIIN